MTSAPMLAYYNLRKALIASRDASLYGIGVVLLQAKDSGDKRSANASRPLSATEQEYAQMEEEALAVTLTYEHFRAYLPGKDLHTADVLLQKWVVDATRSSIRGIEEYKLLTVEQLPVSHTFSD